MNMIHPSSGHCWHGGDKGGVGEWKIHSLDEGVAFFNRRIREMGPAETKNNKRPVQIYFFLSTLASTALVCLI